MRLKSLVSAILITFIGCSSTTKDQIIPIKKKQLKVLAFNIQVGKPQGSEIINLENTASSILASDADLIALQEVDKNTTRSGNVDQAKKLAELTGMHYFFAKAIDYQGGEYGNAVLSKYPILTTKRIELPFKVSGEKRSIAYVTVELPDNSKLDFASIHADTKFENRKEQFKFVSDLGVTVTNHLIIAGDFNAKPKDEEMLLINKSFTYPCNESCPLTYPANTPNSTIDYIVSNAQASKKFRSVSYITLTNQKTSDHLPLLGVYTY